MRLRIAALLLLLLPLSACKQHPSTRPQRKNIVETVYASGTINPENEYTIYSLVSGTIVRKLVQDGDSVSKGQVIYIVRNEAQSARYDAAKQAFETAQLNSSETSPIIADLRLTMLNTESKFRTDSLQYNRSKRLLDSGAITQSQFDDMSTLYTLSLNAKRSAEQRYRSTVRDLAVAAANAKSQLAAAESDLENFSIKSDADGAVFQTMKELGEAVRVSEPVAILGERNKRTIRLAVDQQDVDRVEVGAQVLLKSDITGASIYEGKVVKVYPVMNVADQTFRVDAEFTGTIPTSFVHSSVEANIVIQKKPNALVIPRSLLLPGDSVLVVSDGKNKTVKVTTGILTLDDAEILSGLDEKSVLAEPK